MVICDPSLGGILLLHLFLRGDGLDRGVEFWCSNVKREKLAGATVQSVGHEKYSVLELIRIGEDMIKAFRNHYLIPWNCQTFAKCYLRVRGINWQRRHLHTMDLCRHHQSLPLCSRDPPPCSFHLQTQRETQNETAPGRGRGKLCIGGAVC